MLQQVVCNHIYESSYTNITALVVKKAVIDGACVKHVLYSYMLKLKPVILMQKGKSGFQGRRIHSRFID